MIILKSLFFGSVVQQLRVLEDAITFYIPIFCFHLAFNFLLSAYFNGAQVLSILA